MPKAVGRWSWVYFITLWAKDLLWGKAESIPGAVLPSGPTVVGEASHLLPLQWLSFSVPWRDGFLGGPVGRCCEEAVPGLKVWVEPTNTPQAKGRAQPASSSAILHPWAPAALPAREVCLESAGKCLSLYP